MVAFADEGDVLAANHEAVGLASLKKGFAWEPQDDALFALGWPHLRLLVADHADDAQATAFAEKAIDGSMEGHYLVRWPRQVAFRYLRAFGERGSGALSLRNEHVASIAATEAEPPTEEEARAMIADRVRRGGSTGTWFTEHFVLLLEGVVGSEVVLDALATALEGERGTDEELEQLAFATGFLLLRVPSRVAAVQRKRLQEVLESSSGDDYLTDGLSCAIGGGAAARAVALNPIYYHHALDDPEAVREAVKAGLWLPSARHVFIGGEEVLETIAPHWRKAKETELQRKLAEQLAPIQSLVAVRILAEMAVKSKARKQVPQICAAYAAHMKPHLEALVDDATVGPGAQLLLASVS